MVAKKKDHDFLHEKVPELVISALKGFVTTWSRGVVDAIHKTEKKFLDTFSSYIFYIVGIIFMAIAVVFFIIQYMGLSVGWGFLVIGLILLLYSVILKNRAENIKIRGD